MKKILLIVTVLTLTFVSEVSDASVSYASPSTHRLFSYASNYEGLTERKHTKQIQALTGVNPRVTPWCAAFINGILKKKGYKTTGSNTAISFRHYGARTNNPEIGDIVVLTRKGGNHVGFFAGFKMINGVKHVGILGGNQSNRVKVSYFPVKRVLSYRTPS